MEEVIPTPPKGLLRHLTSGPAWGLETVLPILGRTARSCRTGTVLGWLGAVLPILGRTAGSCRTGTVLGWLGGPLMEEVISTPPKGLLGHLTSGPAWGLETVLPISADWLGLLLLLSLFWFLLLSELLLFPISEI